MSADAVNAASRRHALKCLAYGGAGTLFTLAGGVLTPVSLARAAVKEGERATAGIPLFVQVSDTHIGFSKDANPDVAGTLTRTIELVNAMPDQPDFIHTGDITHLSKPAEFDTAAQLLSHARRRPNCTRRPANTTSPTPARQRIFQAASASRVGQPGLLQLRSRAACTSSA